MRKSKFTETQIVALLTQYEKRVRWLRITIEAIVSFHADSQVDICQLNAFIPDKTNI